MLDPITEDGSDESALEWLGLRRREPSSRRGARPNQFYPIFVDAETGFLHSIGDAVDDDVDRNSVIAPKGTVALWPLKPDDTEMRDREDSRAYGCSTRSSKAILPVTAPLGTVAFTWVSLTTVTVVAFTPSKVTFVVCLRLTPVMVTPFHRAADRREARNLRYDEEFPVAGQHAAGSGHSYGTRRRSAREARGVKAAASCRIPKRLRPRRLSGPP
jgi:hypothetical protein